MVTALIILSVLIIYFIGKTIIKKKDTPKDNRQNKDGSLNGSVSIEYVKARIGVIDNIKCPQCALQSDNLNWFEFRTSDASFRHLAGREGFYAKCPVCDIKVENFITKMS